MEMEIVIWSDNDNIEQVANIIHDAGYRTAGIRKAELGAYENHCNWQWCKINMVDSICVDVNGAIGQIVPTEQVEEQPMFRYVEIAIVGDDDNMKQEDTTEQEQVEEQGEQTMEKRANVTMNIGMTTKDGINIDIESAINKIGSETDCTITRCVGFYKGKKEESLRVEIYDIAADSAVDMASYFARIFQQECVALTVEGKTHFIPGSLSEDEFLEIVDELEK